MFIYIILFLIFLSASIIYRGQDVSLYKKQYYFLCVLLSFVSGIRYHIGSDTGVYIDQFSMIPNISDLFLFIENWNEVLWYIFISVLKTIVDDFIIVQIVHSLIVNLLIGRVIFKLCKKPFWALFFFLCCHWWNFNFEIMRESLCVALYLNVLYNYLQNKNISYFIIFSLPIIFIHQFAFVPILFTILTHFFTYRSVLIGGMFISIIFYFIISDAFILQIMDSWGSGVFSEDVTDRILLYSDSDLYGFKTLSLLGTGLILLTNFICSFVLSKEEENEVIAKLLLLYAFVVILRLKLLIMSRFYNYWELLLFVCAINYLCNNGNLLKKVYLYFCLIFFLYVGINIFLHPLDDSNSKYNIKYIPYASYIDKTICPERESFFY